MSSHIIYIGEDKTLMEFPAVYCIVFGDPLPLWMSYKYAPLEIDLDAGMVQEMLGNGGVPMHGRIHQWGAAVLVHSIDGNFFPF